MKNNSNSDSKLMNLINGIGNAIMMNLMFLVSCIPIVTIGQAWCGLYGAVRFSIRGDSWFQGFKEGFRTRFLRGTVAWTLGLLLIAFMAFQTYSIWFYKVDGYLFPLILSGIMLLIAMAYQASLIPLNVYIPTGIMEWLQNGIGVTFTAPIQTLAVTVLMWLPVALTLFWFEIAFMIAIVFIAAYFSLAAVALTMLMKNTLIRILQAEREKGNLTD